MMLYFLNIYIFSGNIIKLVQEPHRAHQLYLISFQLGTIQNILDCSFYHSRPPQPMGYLWTVTLETSLPIRGF